PRSATGAAREELVLDGLAVATVEPDGGVPDGPAMGATTLGGVGGVCARWRWLPTSPPATLATITPTTTKAMSHASICRGANRNGRNKRRGRRRRPAVKAASATATGSIGTTAARE